MSKRKSSQSAPHPHFNLEFDPKTGNCIKIAPGVLRICAPNKGSYTFSGTNTYLVGKENLFIIDPGPNNGTHLKALLQAIGGRRVVAILLTHTHKDHSSLAKQLQNKTGAPIWFEGRHRLSRRKKVLEINLLHAACDWNLLPDRALIDGEVIQVDDMKLEVIATPGHCANHLCFGIKDTPYLFSGDHVMGWNSTLIATPDGSMADYLASLDRLKNSSWTHYFPGHGAAIADEGTNKNGPRYTAALRSHRKMRNQQILDCIRNGATGIKQIVAQIYPDVSVKIRIAATMTVLAHIEYLAEKKRIIANSKLLGKTRLSIPKK